MGGSLGGMGIKKDINIKYIDVFYGVYFNTEFFLLPCMLLSKPMLRNFFHFYPSIFEKPVYYIMDQFFDRSPVSPPRGETPLLLKRNIALEIHYNHHALCPLPIWEGREDRANGYADCPCSSARVPMLISSVTSFPTPSSDERSLHAGI